MPPVQEILNSNASSFVAANWLTLAGAAGTGFQDDATLNIGAGGGSVTGGLIPGLTNGIKNLDIVGYSGFIGDTAGSLAVQTRASLLDQVNQFPRIRYNAAGGAMNYTPENASANDICHYLQCNGSGRLNVTGTATVARLEVTSGTVNVAGTVGGVTGYRWVLTGGTTTIQSSATQLFSLTVTGGNHTLKRGVAGAAITTTTRFEGLNISGGAVTLDAGSNVFADIGLFGGTLTVLNAGNFDTPTAGITNIRALGGTLDFSRLQRPMIVTLLEDSVGCTIIPSKLLTITARNPIGPGANGLT